MIASYFALQQMPLGIAKMILSSKPVFTLLFARLFLKERVGWVACLAVLFMLAGVVSAVEPWQAEHLGEGYKDKFFLSAVILFFATALGSNISIILR